jgi:hypothetical protein
MVRLKESKLFGDLPGANLRAILESIERVAVREGDVIVRQGDRGDYYYVIDRGTCMVTRRRGDGESEVEVAELGPGDAFGEEDMISAGRCNATVSMRSAGTLLRLDRESFIRLVRDPLIDRIPYRIARRMAAEGATWIDVSRHDGGGTGGLPGALRLPLDGLRRRCNELAPDGRYIVCGEDDGVCATATLLLVQRGFDAVCLRESVSEVLRGEQGSTGAEATPLPPARVVGFPGAEGEASMNETRSGLGRAGAAEEVDSGEPIPRDLYDDTYTGRNLADLIEQMHEKHAELERGSAPSEAETPAIDLESFEREVERSLPALEGSAPALSLLEEEPPPPEAGGGAPPREDEIARFLRELEERLRGVVEQGVKAERARLQADIAGRTEHLKQAAAREVKRQGERLRERYRAEYARREQHLRAQYDKLMALAHKISRQKAEIKRAKLELQAKLAATARLQREIDELRVVLTERIDRVDELEAPSAGGDAPMSDTGAGN